MITLLLILGVVAFILWLILKSKEQPIAPKVNKQMTPTKPITSTAKFDFESPRLFQIIQESIQIINQTKNPATAIRRFDDIKRTISRLLDILPSGKTIDIDVNSRKITTTNDLYIIDEEKAKWMEEHKTVGAKDETSRSNVLSQWVKVFNKAMEDERITWEEMIELQTLQEQLGLTEDDTKPCWSKVEKAALPIRADVPAENTKQLFDAPPSAPWVLTVSFSKSSSKIFAQVLSSVQIHPSFKQTKGPNSEDIYEVAFEPDDILNFDQLWNRIKEWKSTVIKIRGDIVDRNTVSKWLICYRDKLKTKDTNPLFCFGASPFTYNLFGCHRIMLRDGIGSFGMCWYHMGKFDNSAVFHVDREAIAVRVKQDSYLYRICPALDIERIKRGLMLIPEQINVKRDKGWAIEQHYTGIPRIVPIVRYQNLSQDSFKVSAGQFNVDIGVTARMVDYYDSVSPQFKFVLDSESKKQKI